jgi:Zn-dependent protease
MFGRRVNLFRLLDFQVRIDLSWIIIAILVIWSLTKGLFPSYYQGLSAGAYWAMGIAGGLGLFLSIIFHELSHSIVARKYGIPMKGITLFIFGGVAEMSDEPRSPKAEFLMAIAGPLASILMGAVFYTIYLIGTASGWPKPLNGVLGYLGVINGLLAGFNLMPAFPLDGGRVLRSILWGAKGNLRWATWISSRIGSGFGFVLIGVGVIRVLFGNFIGGMWLFLIGMFLQGTARASYQQVLTRGALIGEPVWRFMRPDPVTVPPWISIEHLVADYIYRYHYKMFPVVESEKLLGCVTTSRVKEIPREQWRDTKVGEIAQECSPQNTIGSDEDAMRALSIMRANGSSRLMVVRGDRLVGVIALKDMLGFLSLKAELESQDGGG